MCGSDETIDDEVGGGWEGVRRDMATVDVFPLFDLIEHEAADDCVCGPAIHTVTDMRYTPTGALVPTRWFRVVHASLDGRELLERVTG